MEELKRQYDEKSAQKEELRKKAEITELKLERAGKLVSGLAGERDRWEASVKVWDDCFGVKADRVIFNWLSKVIQSCFGLDLLCSLIGPDTFWNLSILQGVEAEWSSGKGAILVIFWSQVLAVLPASH